MGGKLVAVTPREFVLAFALGGKVPGHHSLHQVVAAVASNTVDIEVQVSDSGSRAVQFAMLCSFVGTFTLTRLVVRMIRSGVGPFGNVKVGSVHVHHLVPGIVIMLVTGPVEFIIAPHGVVRTVLACIFAAGAALTLDEFALWLHLTDVYWEEEGRKSVDAVVAVSGLATLAMIVSNPFARTEGESLWFYFAYLLLTLGFVIVAVFKGRLFMGPAGVLLLPLGIFAALRLAKPGSPWFSRFYKEGSKKYDKSVRRGSRIKLEDRVKKLVSGMPHPANNWHLPERHKSDK
jgi:multisubunit Na+/H+ antiporter MnhF subunit